MSLRKSSFKHLALEHIFKKLTSDGTAGIGENHVFTLKDISDAYKVLDISEPASISNTILDLTRKNRGIDARLPNSISKYGYDLRKKTGSVLGGGRLKYAGEFVFVGEGNTLNSWLVWSDSFDKIVKIPNTIPAKVQHLLAKDEGALFSVIDYCDALSLALYDTPKAVIRVQNPLKWQPNEIDGFYFSDFTGEETLIPIEAKALSTGDDINLEQMLGAYTSLIERANKAGFKVLPLGIQMIENGMRIAVLRRGEKHLELDKTILATFDPPVASWKKGKIWYNVRKK